VISVTGAITFRDTILAVHIAAVLIGFGIIFAYPLIFGRARRRDPRALPALHRLRGDIELRLMTPGLVVILLAGIYLASSEHEFKSFFVQWGFGAVVVLGGLIGAYFAPRERRLAQLAQRDVDASGDGELTLGPEYAALYRQVAMVTGLASLLVLLTVFFMATHAGH